MSEKILGLVVNVRKYNDRNNVVTLYTRSRGRLTFISPIGSGKSAAARRARLQPLTLVAAEIHYKPTAELQRLGAISSPEIWSDIYFHPHKRIIALFVSEFLYHLLNATMADEKLFDFLVEAIRLLDRMKEGVADFHIPFLVSLLSFSGIQPDVSSYRPGMVFDIHSGSFLYPEETSGPIIISDDAAHIPLISRLNFTNIKKFRPGNAGRRQILYGLLNYYSYHFPGLGNLKSPEVLRQLFQ